MEESERATKFYLIVPLCLVLFAMSQLACGKPSLIGRWNRVASGDCYWQYPAKLEFFEDGTYVGAFPNWNGGKYNVVEGSRLKIDTLTGLGVYNFQISGKLLKFRNDSNCEFEYTRAK
jgi:hypothetical protein